MEEPELKNKATSVASSLLIKSALVFLLFYLYIAVMWFWDSQNIITKISGFFAIVLCFLSLFVPTEDNSFKKMLIFVAGFTILFYASQWLEYAL